jgi:hypothetical protein
VSCRFTLSSSVVRIVSRAQGFAWAFNDPHSAFGSLRYLLAQPQLSTSSPLTSLRAGSRFLDDSRIQRACSRSGAGDS